MHCSILRASRCFPLTNLLPFKLFFHLTSKNKYYHKCHCQTHTYKQQQHSWLETGFSSDTIISNRVPSTRNMARAASLQRSPTEMVWNGNSSQDSNNSRNVVVNLLTSISIKRKHALKFFPLLETSVHRHPFFLNMSRKQQQPTQTLVYPSN